ncbi:MAG: hypothetical protein DSY53_04660 [Persephonella sp.]|nr:MAG: hypothetical protein DSY53_04660 [Persephonella sp.]
MLAEHYIQLADSLVSSDLGVNKITAYKTAIERYYYGSFLACKETLLEAIYPYREKDLLNRNVHSIVKRIFLHSNLYQVASLLEELKALRNEVEYNPAFVPTDYDVELSKRYAYEIFSILEEINEENIESLKNAYLSLRV